MILENSEIVGKLCVTFLLSGIVLFAFIKLLFLGKLYSKVSQNKFKLVQQDLVRLIGGATVFLIAIVASNPWIYFVSFLIGGLLIASEQFMILLAGVLSSDRKNVFKIIKYVSEMSKDEVARRVELEAQEIVEAETEDSDKITPPQPAEKNEEISSKKVENKTAVQESKLVDQLDNAKKSIKFFERAVAQRINDRVISWAYNVRQNVRVVDAKGNAHVHDIIVIDGDNKLFATAEIKLIGSMSLNMVKRVIDRSDPDAQPSEIRKIFIFGFRDYDYNETNRLLEFRTQMKVWDNNVGIVYFQLTTDESGSLKLESINTEDMQMFKDENVELPF